MTTIAFPIGIIPTDVGYEQIVNSQVLRSPLNLTPQIASRPGSMWRFTPRFERLEGADRREMETFVRSCRSMNRRFYMPDLSQPVHQGNMTLSELVTNGDFDVDTTGWSAVGGEVDISVNSRKLKITRNAVTANNTVRQSAWTVVNAATYVVRYFFMAGRGTMNARINVGTTAGNNDILSGAARSETGWYEEEFVASGTSAHFSVADIYTGKSAGDFFFVDQVTCHRSARVVGASQTGDSINIDGLPASTSGCKLAGETIGISNKMYRLAADLDSDSGGAGTAIVESPIITAPADNTPVVLFKPRGIFVLGQSVITPVDELGYSSVALDCMEDIWS